MPNGFKFDPALDRSQIFKMSFSSNKKVGVDITNTCFDMPMCQPLEQKNQPLVGTLTFKGLRGSPY